MTDIENLTAILGKMQDCGAKEHPAGQGDRIELLQNREVAVALIENGVTVQRWIPVTERLPEMKEVAYDDGFDITSYRISSLVLGCADDGMMISVRCELDNPDDSPIWSEDCGTSHIITHWMPLPAAPKEVDE